MKEENFAKTGHGPNIIFLHGWKHDRHTWDAIVPFFEKDYTCWCIDLPGFGQNPLPKSTWSITEYAHWVKKFIEENNIKNPTIVGHSFGGRVAIELNRIYSDIKVNVLYATPGLRQPIPMFKSMAFSIYKGLKNKSQVLKNTKILDRVNFIKKLRHKLRSDDYREAGELKNIFLSTIHYNLVPSMEKMSKPTYLLWGAADNIVPIKIAQEMQKIIKNSQLITIDGLGHLAHIENPRLFSGLLTKILNDKIT